VSEDPSIRRQHTVPHKRQEGTRAQRPSGHREVWTFSFYSGEPLHPFATRTNTALVGHADAAVRRAESVMGSFHRAEPLGTETAGM